MADGVRRPLIRDATAADAAACAAIYAPYVTDSAVTFELEPPTAADMAGRIDTCQARHAFLVAEVAEVGGMAGGGGIVAGYAYGAAFAARPAYRWSCEVSVYVDRARHRTGTGRALYGSLLQRLRERGLQVAVAKVSLPNEASEALHRRLGFEPVGVHRRIGFKHGSWHDVALLQRELVPPRDPEPTAQGTDQRS